MSFYVVLRPLDAIAFHQFERASYRTAHHLYDALRRYRVARDVSYR